MFIEILHTGITEFERYRQSLIRDINVKNKDIKKEEKTIIEKVVKNPTTIKQLTSAEEKKFVNELSIVHKEKQEYRRTMQDTENRYKYDVRILNVLATSGLRATAIAHEMKNDRNKIAGNYEFIIKALKMYDLWEELNEPEKTRVSHQNIPELLKNNNEAGKKILQFMDIMLEDVEKQQFISGQHNVGDVLYRIKDNWERDYAWLNINIQISESVMYIIPEDVITVVFNNLILNSIQQNERKRNKLNIKIAVDLMNDLLSVIYKDDGIGLSDKFKMNPMKILEPHETSRKKGHGLGMWIVNNTLEMSGGEVLGIEGNKGFQIRFTVGGKL